MSENENMNHNPEVNESEEDKSPLETFIYHQRKALEEAGKALDALLPDGFKSHGSEAGKEFVKSFKVLVDAAITEIEKATTRVQTVEGEEGGDDRPATTGKTKVKVQVD
ncbi:MAG: hypothetical protein K8L97_03350 [Anaerolineae bacterium]|nr:hypothetical protein [Anaerolineae bacterium]